MKRAKNNTTCPVCGGIPATLEHRLKIAWRGLKHRQRAFKGTCLRFGIKTGQGSHQEANVLWARLCTASEFPPAAVPPLADAAAALRAAWRRYDKVATALEAAGAVEVETAAALLGLELEEDPDEAPKRRKDTPASTSSEGKSKPVEPTTTASPGHRR